MGTYALVTGILNGIATVGNSIEISQDKIIQLLHDPPIPFL